MRVRLGRGRAWRRWRTSAPLHLLCTCSAPALHPLCTRSAPAPPAPLHPRLCTTRCAPSAGFYVQPGPHAASRLPIALAPGDLIAHSFDTQHGVEVPPDIGEISRRYRGDIGEIARHAARRRGAASRAPGCSPAPPRPAQPGCSPAPPRPAQPGCRPAPPRPAQPGCSPVCPGYKPVSRTVSGSRLCPPRLQAARALAAGRCTHAPMPPGARRAAARLGDHVAHGLGALLPRQDAAVVRGGGGGGRRGRAVQPGQGPAAARRGRRHAARRAACARPAAARRGAGQG